MIAVLSSAFFAPVQWYQKLARFDQILIENCDSYQKQTYRNRCLIATTNGVQALTIPVQRDDSQNNIIISEHGNWRHLHWHALMSAYGETPFFEFYADDIQPFFTERYDSLYDLNIAITRKICSLIDIHPNISLTKAYIHDYSEYKDVTDFRAVITPKHPLTDSTFSPKPYYQVYAKKHGFLPNLSILDLLFNMGPEAILFL